MHSQWLLFVSDLVFGLLLLPLLLAVATAVFALVAGALRGEEDSSLCPADERDDLWSDQQDAAHP